MKKALLSISITILLIGNVCKAQTKTTTQPKPTIVANVSGHKGKATIPLKEIGSLGGVNVESTSEDKYVVISYVVSMVVKGKLLEYTVNGPELSKEAVNILINVQKGSKIFFDKVKVKGADGKEREIPGVSLTVI